MIHEVQKNKQKKQLISLSLSMIIMERNVCIYNNRIQQTTLGYVEFVTAVRVQILYMIENYVE